MAEKNIFVYKLFLSLNISDLVYFLCKNWNPSPPVKGHPPLSWQPPLKIQILPNPPPPRFENLVGGSTPLPAEMECTLCVPNYVILSKIIKRDAVLNHGTKDLKNML